MVYILNQTQDTSYASFVETYQDLYIDFMNDRKPSSECFELPSVEYC